MSRQPWTDPVPDANLEARWKLDEGQGTNVADSSGNSLDGTAFGGMTWVPGMAGSYAGGFDGTDDVVTTGSTLTGSLGSVAAWVYIDVHAFDNSSFLAGTNTGDDARYLQFRIEGTGSSFNPQAVTIAQRNNDTGDVIQSTNTITAGEWNHIVITSDGSAYKIFINGTEETLVVQAGSNTGDWFGDTSLNQTCIGAFVRSITSSYLNGQIDDIRVYSRALTAREAKSIYKTGLNSQPQAPTANLNGHWPFDEGAGITAVDVSGNNNTLTANGAVSWAVVGERNGPYSGDFSLNNHVFYTSDDSALGFTSDFSGFAWINLVSYQGTIMYKGVTGSAPRNYQLSTTAGGNLSFNFYDGSSYKTHTDGQVIPLNTWVHVGWVFDVTNDTVYLYQDAVETLNAAETSNPPANSEVFTVGGDGGVGVASVLVGYLDDPRLYGAALTAAQVRQLYRATRPPFGVRNLPRGGGQ